MFLRYTTFLFSNYFSFFLQRTPAPAACVAPLTNPRALSQQSAGPGCYLCASSVRKTRVCVAGFIRIRTHELSELSAQTTWPLCSSMCNVADIKCASVHRSVRGNSRSFWSAFWCFCHKTASHCLSKKTHCQWYVGTTWTGCCHCDSFMSHLIETSW
jgi:hypothetical protein